MVTIGTIALAGAMVSSIDYVFENVMQAHQRTRINVLLGKEVDIKGAGYNVQQSKIAIGSGGIWGKGFLQGTQNKFRFVPEQSTDFIVHWKLEIRTRGTIRTSSTGGLLYTILSRVFSTSKRTDLAEYMHGVGLSIPPLTWLSRLAYGPHYMGSRATSQDRS